MDDTKPSPPKPSEIHISPDRMTVTLDVKAGTEASAADIITRLREMKLAGFDDGLVIQSLEQRKGGAVCIAVAEGVPAVDERPERIDYRVPFADGSSSTVSKVHVGQVIAAFSPAVPGKDGHDVFGTPLLHKKNQTPFQIGRNLALAKGEIVSSVRGNLRLNRNVLSVEPLLELRGDEACDKPVLFDGDAMVKGSLNDGWNLQISGALTVGGAVEAVQLKTGGSVNVKGGLIGKQKGKFVIGGDLWCRFISGGVIIAAENIRVQSEITNTKIVCCGKVTTSGPIFGGTVAANGGIACDVLGNPAGATTAVEAGNGPACRSVFASTSLLIDANRKRIADVRSTIAPFLNVMKKLTPSQREKAMELMYEADELEATTNKMVEDSDKQNRRLTDRATAEILVETIAYPGVKITFPGVETVLTMAFKGPLLLTAQKSGAAREIVLIDRTDQSRTVLPSTPTDSTTDAKSPPVVRAQAA